MHRLKTSRPSLKAAAVVAAVVLSASVVALQIGASAAPQCDPNGSVKTCHLENPWPSNPPYNEDNTQWLFVVSKFDTTKGKPAEVVKVKWIGDSKATPAHKYGDVTNGNVKYRIAGPNLRHGKIAKATTVDVYKSWNGTFRVQRGPLPNPPPPVNQFNLVPLYDGDLSDSTIASQWKTTCSQVNAAGTKSLVVANVESGPGPASLVPRWKDVIENCRQPGKASVIGYVPTYGGNDPNYQANAKANHPISWIEQQIDIWYSLYPGDIAGIFFDQAVDNPAFYGQLANYEHTHHPGSKVVYNPGMNPSSGWMFTPSQDTPNSNYYADIVVTFEGAYNSGTHPYTAWSQASWESSYSSAKFAALVYGAPNTGSTPQPSKACVKLKSENIGFLYVGAGDLPTSGTPCHTKTSASWSSYNKRRNLGLVFRNTR